MLRFFLFTFLLVIHVAAIAQHSIDTIPFSTENHLIVFKGKINGVETLFAYDTGAGLGVLSKTLAEKTGVQSQGSKKVSDSNHKEKSMDFAIIEKLQIGAFELTSINNVIYDMPFLSCNDYYLLGANSINQLNWKIDFHQKLIYVSKEPFLVDNNMIKMKLKLKKNTHFTHLSIGNIKMRNCLIDFGFTGFFEGSDQQKEFKKLKKISPFVEGYGFSMGLSSARISPVTTLKLNGLKLDSVEVKNVSVETRSSTTTKIGVRFFEDLTETVILNISDNSYYLQLKNKPEYIDMSYGLDIYLMDGKLRVVGVRDKNAASTASFSLNEELKSVNGKTSADFPDECAYLEWRMNNRHADELVIEKMNGEKIILKKVVFE